MLTVETTLKSSKLLDALACRNTGRPPIWLMRQAGRYMPEYRAIRKNHPFTTMCRTPEIAAEVTLQPIKQFGFDAAIIFSDILVIADVLDLGLRFEDGKGPIIEKPVRTVQDVAALPSTTANDVLGYVPEAIKLVKKELEVPLIGFSGAPFTVASYLIEGCTSKKMKLTKTWMLEDPVGFHTFLDKITSITIDYLNMQIDAGANAIQIFDSWANFLAYPQFQEFSLAYMKKIIQGIRNPDIPIILFCKGASVFLNDLANAGPACVALDWNIDIGKARKIVPKDVALQGNLDPDVLYAPFPVIEREAKRLLNTMKGEKGYIFNLGHGILPDMSPGAIRTLVECVQSYEA